MNPNNLVCRTCLGIISEGKIAHNIDDENGIIKNVRNIREMIMFCVPEMDIYVSISPVICESCISTLVSVYNFKIRCLRVENAIRSYIVANNVLEGSCVNLNNVVRQQIVEALKQKNWPPEFIKQYVDEHLCTSKTSAISPVGVPGEVLKAVTQKFGVPRMPGNTVGPRHLPLNLYENPSMAPGNILLNLSSMPSPSNYPSPSMEIPPSGGPPPQPPVALPGTKYISVSKNLMPPRRPELPFSPPPPAKSLGPLGQSREGEFQHAFLNSLQLTSSANGGRQEAVLLNTKQKAAKPKTYMVKKVQKPKKSNPMLGSLLQLSGQNAVLPMSSKNLTIGSLLSPVEDPSTKESESVLNPFARVSPTSGIIRNVNMTEQEVNSLRKVRKTPANKNTKKGLDSEVISIDDDDDNVCNGPIVELIGNNEMLIMNFDEGDLEIVNGTKQAQNAEPNFSKIIRVEVPMIDRETMKRKLTPEDVIEEIESKRRRLTVKLSNRLPYLHKNKKLVVKLQQDRFFTCMFCKFTALRMKTVKKHYWTHHKVCALCNFKCNRQSSQLTYHIYTTHQEAVEEAIKQKDEKKPEFYCYLCNFTGLSGADLRDHRFRVHLNCDSTGMYHCPVITCTKELAIAYDMISHIETAHDKTRNTQCPLCNTRTSSKHYLGKHLETHRWSRVTCQFCRHVFKTTAGLETHMKNKHPQTENLLGMVSASDSTSCNDDYIVTLDNLQSSQATSGNQAASNNSRIEDRNLDEYEFAMPSFSEMLCDQTLIEEPPNQPGECTVVHPVTTTTNKKKSTAKTTKKRPRKAEKKKPPSGDLDDCLIVNQEIETVDVSDEDASDSDVIEINDEDDNDCVVVEASAQPDSPRNGSETDTCSEISEAARQQTPQGAVTEDQTDSCSELRATDILARKKASSEGSSVKENEIQGTLQSDSENVNSESDATCLEKKQSNEDAPSENEKNKSTVVDKNPADSEKDKSDDNVATPQEAENEDTSSERERNKSTVADKNDADSEKDDNAAKPQEAENETDICSELSATDIVAEKTACNESNLVTEKEDLENLQSSSLEDKNVEKKIDARGSENKNDQSNEDDSSERDRKESTEATKNLVELMSDSDMSNDESQKMSDKETSETECQSQSRNNEELDSVKIDSSKKESTDGTKNNEDQGTLEEKGSESLEEKCSESLEVKGSESIKNSEENTSGTSEIQKTNAVVFEKGNVDSEEPVEKVLSVTNPENSDLLNQTSESSEQNKLETSEANQNISNKVEGTKDVLDTDIHMEDVTDLIDSQKKVDSEVVESQSSFKLDASETETINFEAIANETVLSESDQPSVDKRPQNECDKTNSDSLEYAQKNLMDILEVADNIREDCHSMENVSDDSKSKEKSLADETENDNSSVPTGTEENFVVLDEA